MCSCKKAFQKETTEFFFTHRNKNKVESLINDIRNNNSSADIEIAESIKEACWEADIIIAAVPYATEKEVAENIRNVTNQKIVVSVCNPLNNSYNGLVITPEISAAEELQKLLPHAKVVKAFNTILACNFYHPVINGQQADCFIAGNDENALQTVYDLVKTAGFNPIIAGDLSISRTLESMQLLLIQLSMQNNYNGIAGWKILHN